jgi:hypothetical protein
MKLATIIIALSLTPTPALADPLPLPKTAGTGPKLPAWLAGVWPVLHPVARRIGRHRQAAEWLMPAWLAVVGVVLLARPTELV